MWNLLVSTSMAATLTVGPSGNFSTLAPAIDAALPGDVIEISPGDYTTNVRIDKPLTLEGSGAGETRLMSSQKSFDPTLKVLYTDGVAIRDLSVLGTPVNQPLYVEDANVTLEDVTLRSGSRIGHRGALAQLSHSRVTFRRATFLGKDAAADHGGVLYATASALLVEDSTFEAGTAENFGGAVSVHDGDVTFLRSVFTNNIARSGGAIEFTAGPSNTLHVEDCSFSNNWSEDPDIGLEGFGGGVVSFGGHVSLLRSTFSNNVAQYGGGAVDLSYTASSLVLDCVFEGNTAGVDGGAIATYRTPSVTMRRNRFVDNTSSFVGGAILLGGAGTFDVHGNRFCGCEAPNGGAIAVNGWTAPLVGTIRNNLMTGNEGTLTASSVLMWGTADASLVNNTVHGGVSPDSMLLVDPTATLVATNNAFVSNRSRAVTNKGGAVSMSHNLYWDQGEAPAGSEASVLENPNFTADEPGCDATYHPGPESPLLDAGIGTILDGDGSPSDIGAYGGPAAATVWDLDSDGVIDGDCSPFDGSLWEPGEEVVGDGKDQDCDGLDLCFIDADGDGVGGEALGVGNCVDEGFADSSGDCDDADPTRFDDCSDRAGPQAPGSWFCGSVGGRAPWFGALILLCVTRRRRLQPCG